MIEFKIGPRFALDGSPITVPDGVLIPRPFDIRVNNRNVLGRTNGGTLVRGQFINFDFLYETTGDIAKALRAVYNPTQPLVWVQLYDHITVLTQWYSATMLEPHIERGAGSVITGLTVGFRNATLYAT